MPDRSKKDVSQTLKELEEGITELFESERYMQYLSVLSRFHRYSMRNQMLIMRQRPDATMVAGYNQWKDRFNRHVNKGEKAIQILVPVTKKVTYQEPLFDEDGKPLIDAEGKPQTQSVERKRLVFKFGNVFDISQTDGEPLPSITNKLEGDYSNYEEVFTALKCLSPAPISFAHIDDGANGYYNYVDKKIVIEETLDKPQTIKTCIHEIAHAVVHDAEIRNNQVQDTRTMEVQAESIAYVVCNHLGIDSSDYTFGYIAGWSSGKELKELKDSLEVIGKASQEIINRLDEALAPKELPQQAQLDLEMERPHCALSDKMRDVDTALEGRLKETLKEHAETVFPAAPSCVDPFVRKILDSTVKDVLSVAGDLIGKAGGIITGTASHPEEMSLQTWLDNKGIRLDSLAAQHNEQPPVVESPAVGRTLSVPAHA